MKSVIYILFQLILFSVIFTMFIRVYEFSYGIRPTVVLILLFAFVAFYATKGVCYILNKLFGFKNS